MANIKSTVVQRLVFAGIAAHLYKPERRYIQGESILHIVPCISNETPSMIWLSGYVERHRFV